MRFKVERYEIRIIPEDPSDEAYIEEVLGLRHGGDGARAIRVNAMGLNCLAYVKIAPAPGAPPSGSGEEGT